mmetsp:Transcript_1650/g.4705  ORF Transcript_1650/g.4705 Transcript_1650/m.4705 type:complete len:293 (-) Transcript_1650:171-1049(-)
MASLVNLALVGVLWAVAANAEGSSLLQLHTALTQKAQGHWSKTCAMYPGKRIVFLSVSSQFTDLFDNWLYHAAPHLNHATEQVVALAENAEVLPVLRQMSGAYGVNFDTQFDKSWHHIGNATSNCDHLTASYGSVVTHRPEVIKGMLEANCTVFYQDVDTAWKSSVLSVLDASGVHDVMLADDDPRDDGKPSRDLCSCLMYIQPTLTSREFVRRWAAADKGNVVNQPFMNDVLLDMRGWIDVHVLSNDQFPCGKNAANASKPVSLHANWLVGTRNKTAFFKKFHMWHIPDKE